MTYDLPTQGPWARHFGGGAPSAPPPPPPPPSVDSEEVRRQKLKEAKAIRLKKGRGASILTGDQQFLQPSGEEGKATLG